MQINCIRGVILMAVKISDQISIVDVTDAYSVILTSESHTFAGTT